jgi:hypothetical protein
MCGVGASVCLELGQRAAQIDLCVPGELERWGAEGCGQPRRPIQTPGNDSRFPLPDLKTLAGGVCGRSPPRLMRCLAAGEPGFELLLGFGPCANMRS